METLKEMPKPTSITNDVRETKKRGKAFFTRSITPVESGAEKNGADPDTTLLIKADRDLDLASKC